MNANDVKQKAISYGAKICGIGSVERFNSAPEGFGPQDLFPKTKSVISFANQVPHSSLNISSFIPYSVLEEVALHETHRIGLELALFLENNGYEAIMVPSEPYEYWNIENNTGKGLVSLKHLAYYSGLGVWGRNHLLYNKQLGNLMRIGAVLTNAALDADPVLTFEICKPTCNICIAGCPGDAITTDGVIQSRCRSFSEGKTLKGDSIYACNECRKNCPNVKGFN